MNRFKIIILSGVITALCSHFAWAGAINSISVDQENRIVVVSVQLSENSIDEALTKTAFIDGLFDIEIYTVEDMSTPVDYEVLVSFAIPQCSEYSQIGVVLYASGGHAQMSAGTAMSTGIDCDAGVNNCQDDYDTCVSCQVDCTTSFMAFLSDCSADGCKTAEECQSDLETCNALWDAAVVEEPAAMTVQPIFPEVAESVKNIMVDVGCRPKRLNLKSKGKWITCSVKVPEGSPEDIDIDSVKLNYMDTQGLGVSKSKIRGETLKIKFSRQELIGLIDPEGITKEIELTVNGSLVDETPFFGKDTMRVIDRGKKKRSKKMAKICKNKKK